MKKFLKEVLSFITLLFSSVVWVPRVLFRARWGVSKDLKRISGERSGDECFVFANGPSLQEVLDNHSSEMSNSDIDVAVLNMFCESPYFLEIKPRYYILADPAFFVSDNEIKPVHKERVLRIRRVFLEKMQLVTWNMYLFVPSSVNNSEVIGKIVSNVNIEVVKVNMSEIHSFKPVEFFAYRHNLAMPPIQSVVIAALFEMINLGYKTIYAFGIDHNWIHTLYVNDENILMSHDDHFYGSQEITIGHSLDLELQYQINCFRSHQKINEYANYCGAIVLNSTKGSYVDAYVRSLYFK